jgi:hypothetical protein
MRKRIGLLLAVAVMVATMMGAAGAAFADEIPPPPPPEAVHCNAGNGNGNEGCDPGNSAPQNRGGDEIGAPVDEGGSTENPGGNNVAA